MFTSTRTAITAFLLLPELALAGGLQVFPVRVDVNESQPAASVTVENLGEHEISIRAAVLSWSQSPERGDLTTATEDFTLRPTTASIPAGESLTVHLAYGGEALSKVEKTYRLVVDELAGQAGPGAVASLLTVSLPVFVQPGAWQKRGPPVVELEWSEIEITAGLLEVSLRNPGPRHGFVSSVRAVGRDEHGAALFDLEMPGWYVLPGAEQKLFAALDPELCVRTATIALRAEPHPDDELPLSPRTVTVSPSEESCAPP